MSDTPRTDAEIEEYDKWIHVDFTRQLERELREEAAGAAKLLAEVERLRTEKAQIFNALELFKKDVQNPQPESAVYVPRENFAGYIDILLIELRKCDGTELTTLRRKVTAAKGLAEACGYKPGEQWVLMKRGLYYRPDAKGYTSNILEAWVVSEAVADSYTYPHDEPVTKQRYEPPERFRAALTAWQEANK